MPRTDHSIQTSRSETIASLISPETDDLLPLYATREVVSVFASEQALEPAVDQLLTLGFDRSQISVLAQRNSTSGPTPTSEIVDHSQVLLGTSKPSSQRAGLGTATTGLPDCMAVAGGYAAVIGPGSSLAFAVAALLLAGVDGSDLRGLLAHTIGHHLREAVAAQIAEGGLLLWVSVHDSAQEKMAIRVVNQQEGRYVHVHDVESGWGMHDVSFHDARSASRLEDEHRTNDQ